ncbi:MAG TPA: cyclopropane fatty acyl phospholipid synthase [Patescibacteria group bacterium]|nr:cyclopropane fatty acyl phospholipid synthase [Patescibacteria group bacterium]
MKQAVQNLLDYADVKINGDRPWDIQVHNDKLYSRVLSGGSLALGESYMDGWWDVKELDEFFSHILSANLDKKIRPSLPLVGGYIKSKILNEQTKRKARVVGERHYDIGNDLYERMLDKRMTYTCGYWKDAKSLDEAQEAKLDLTCRKLGLKPGMKVLDIGCGWGSFAIFAARKYGVEVVGVTISKEQVELGNIRAAGLPVELRFQDYRDVQDKFDRIVSLGMFEHVGKKNYREYMKVVERCLKDDGLFLLHTIGGNKSTSSTDPWIAKYIFPNSMLPSAAQITKSAEGIFRLEDWHNFGPYYDNTLMAWFNNFHSHWGEIKEKYGDRFYRMWKYYLLACAGSFRSRKNQLWQIVLAKVGSVGRYESIR